MKFPFTPVKPAKSDSKGAKRGAPAKKGRLCFARRALACLFALCALLCAFMYACSRVVNLCYSDVYLHDLAPELDGVSILFVSDLHASGFSSPEQLSAVIHQLDAQLEPDLLLLGGDYSDFGLDSMLLKLFGLKTHAQLSALERERRARMFALMEDIRPPLGKFAVRGNHDIFLSGLDEALQSGGFTLLVNSVARVEKNGAQLVVAGLDDFGEGTPDISAIAQSVEGGEAVVLLSHNPDALIPCLNRPARDGGGWVDLMLTGHLHGGQIRLPFLPPFYLPSASSSRFLSGWFEESGALLLNSNGLGATSVPFRLFAPAQAHFIRLHPAGARATETTS